MSNINYSPDAQNKIDAAEDKLGDAIKNLKTQIKEPKVEIIPEPDDEVEVEVTQKKEPRRSEFVQTDDPKVIERINDLYGQVKKSDAAKQMILEHNRTMEQKLSEYAEKLEKFERATKDSASDKVESELKTRLRTAREEHDLDTIEQIEDKLLDLRMEKRIAGIPKAVPTAAPQLDQRIVHNAMYIENVSNEKDAQGNLVRPYLFDWHPDNTKAVELFKSIPKEFEAAGKHVDLKTVIEVIDERMKGKKPRSSSVLSGNDDDIPERKTVKLTSQQVYTAKRMGITPEAYARQLQFINS